ncbi:MAG: PspC domain-containing protein [Bacteroidales bacterium]|jgi:phage shock protein PspC (stress-responsive transcriptional regulator)|nr:PspC domain-containing protein [Bacteroidales bacterium]MDD3702209.1 PspC domain-containing protein [Bacteroidales bacterium]MDY0368917.1 PspC domain-containing protein [Bacteroidales bacterium]
MSTVKRLYRSRLNRMVGGVCSGLADYFGLDVTLIRLAWVLFVALAGTGLLAYIICWIVIPESPL